MQQLEQEKIEIPARNFDLSSFKKATDAMIATSNSAYSSYHHYGHDHVRRYSEEEIQNIIENGSLLSQQKLSKDFFNKEGFYKQIITYYATLLKYSGLLIPNASYGKQLSSPSIKKRYYAAMDYVDKMYLQSFFINCALKALVNGSYYGIILQTDKKTFSSLDLPFGYATSRYKDVYGNDIIEFNLNYFNNYDEQNRKNALNAYPKFIQQAYKKMKSGDDCWIKIPADIGICFPFFDGRPPFLDVIPTTIEYDKAVKTEQERDKEDIRKIIIQKMPHLADGRLLFEPEEAEVMHKASVQMLRGNDNLRVLTTYTDVDAIVSNTSGETSNSTLQRMLNNIYSKAGVSSQLFASTGSSTLESSVKTDIAFMMYIANKFSKFVSDLINRKFSNGNIDFKYTILPVGYQNETKYIDSMLKLATTGYSFLYPAIAAGISQKDLIGIKELENDVLELGNILIPLSSSYTQSGSGVQNQVGRPQKEQEEKSNKTIQNEESKDRQTGGTE